MKAMRISVAYSEPDRQVWLHADLDKGATVRQAIELSGILELFPSIDLSAQKIGVFGRVVKPDAALRDGDRVEIYRPITCDPQTVPRRDGEEGEE